MKVQNYFLEKCFDEKFSKFFQSTRNYQGFRMRRFRDPDYNSLFLYSTFVLPVASARSHIRPPCSHLRRAAHISQERRSLVERVSWSLIRRITSRGFFWWRRGPGGHARGSGAPGLGGLNVTVSTERSKPLWGATTEYNYFVFFYELIIDIENDLNKLE